MAVITQPMNAVIFPKAKASLGVLPMISPGRYINVLSVLAHGVNSWGLLMAKGSIWIEDQEGGGVNVGVDFGDDHDANSRAHSMIAVLLESILGSAQHFEKIEDTVEELDVEPKLIVTK